MITKNRKYIKFTEEEDAIIIAKVKEFPTNLRNAFKEVSNLLENRTLNDVENRWYRCLRPNTNINALTIVSKHGASHNRKNVKRDKLGLMPDPEIRAVDNLMKILLEMAKEDREKIINFFR